MTSYEHKVKNIYLGSPYNEGTPLIPGDYTLLRGPCDEGFHVPLAEERQAIKDASVTASQCKTNLHIPLAYSRSYLGTWDSSTTAYAYLWSSSPNERSGNRNNSKYMYFYSDNTNITITADGRAAGKSIRAFKNTPIIPDETRTETVTGKIWYNSDLGLISILVGTNQYVTLQDKNVGATEVYNGTLNANNRGKYFQRGNNYGFTWNSSGDTSSVRIDASGYGPSNPYSSSTFRRDSNSPYDRSTVENDNLRGYEDFNS